MHNQAASKSGHQELERHLNWPGCYNARDLGGLPIADGLETRRGVMVRSELLNDLTAAGRKALLDYGVRTIIDLRSPPELAEAPSIFAAEDGETFRYMNIPLIGEDPDTNALIDQAQSYEELYALILDHYAGAVAGALRAIAEAPPGAILFHCLAGKDRTGIIAALLLRLAGVPPAIVAADFAVSRERLWPLYEKMVAEAGGEDQVDPWLKPVTPAETMLWMLDYLDANYGGVEGYLRTAGLTTPEIDRLRSRLRPG